MPAQLRLDFGGAAPFHLQVFGSSSGGNCTALWKDGRALLVDAGFGPRAIERCLERHDLGLHSISGVAITHIHADHVNEFALGSLGLLGIPFFSPPEVLTALARNSAAGRELRKRGLLQPLKGLNGIVGPFGIEAFPVPHDSPGGCFGYSIWIGETKMTIATDLGFPGPGLVERFEGSRVIVIESNHDPEMLERSGRPAWLKRRIRERGHLSNGQCADFVAEVLEASSDPPQAILVAHISQECNTNELAVGCTREMIAVRGYGTVPVLETFADRPAAVVQVSPGQQRPPEVTQPRQS
jgi:phosphoribosyl 1,2-cyclic phosphodiesterase